MVAIGGISVFVTLGWETFGGMDLLLIASMRICRKVGGSKAQVFGACRT